MTQTPDQSADQQAQFTDQEAGVIRSAAMRAAAAVAAADPGFLDTFKESFAASKAVKAAPAAIQRLVAGGGLPEMPKGGKEEVQARTMELVRQAVGILQTKAPQLVDGFRQVVLQSARDVAEAAKGTSATESQVIDELQGALEGDGGTTGGQPTAGPGVEPTGDPAIQPGGATGDSPASGGNLGAL